MLDLGVGDVGEVGAFGEEVPDQAVAVLVGGALPGRVGIAEVGLAARSEGEAGVLGHLDALVPGEGRHQGGRESVGHLDQCVGHGGGVTAGDPLDHGVAGGAFVEGHQGRGVALADDEVSFPVSGNCPVLDLGRAVGDGGLTDPATDAPPGQP